MSIPITRSRLGPAWNRALFIGLMLLMVAVQEAVRRRLTTPRLGYAKSKGSPALKWILVATIALVVLLIGICLLISFMRKYPVQNPEL